MAAEDATVRQLDLLRCASRWTGVAALLRSMWESIPPTIAVPALVETKLESLLSEARQSPLEPARGMQRAITQLIDELQSRWEACPDTPTGNAAYIHAVLEAQLQFLAGHSKTTISVLGRASEPPNERVHEYERVALVKSRALMGTAYARVGDKPRARHTFNSIVIADSTLAHVPEVVRWAKLLYEEDIKLTSGLNRIKALQNYFRVANIGGGAADDRYIGELYSVLREDRAGLSPAATEKELAQMDAYRRRHAQEDKNLENGGTALSSADTAPVTAGIAGVSVAGGAGAADYAVRSDTAGAAPSAQRPAGTAATHSAQRPVGIADTTGASASHTEGRNGTIATGEWYNAPSGPQTANPRNGHLAAATVEHTGAQELTPMQRQIIASAKIEKQAEVEVSAWRSSMEFQEPNQRVTLADDVAKTKALFEKIVKWSEETFDSTVIMGLQTEVLVSLGQFVEAFAAFRTYVAYQKLQLLKEKTGSHASPQHGEKLARLFSLMLGVIMSDELGRDQRNVDRATELSGQLTEVLPEDSPKAVAMAHGVLATSYFYQSKSAVGDDFYNDRTENAGKHFKQAFSSWDGDAQTLFAYGQYLAQQGNTTDAYLQVKGALERYPDNIPLWRLLILLLTAQNQLEAAQGISEGVLANNVNDGVTATSGLYKSSLLEIEKTRVAIVEARFGIIDALEQLPESIRLAKMLYPQAEAVFGKESVGRVASTAELGRRRRNEQGRRLVSDTSDARSHGANRRSLLSRALGRKSNRVPRELPAQKTKTTSQLEWRMRDELEKLWIWIAQLYTRAALLDEAEQALTEAAVVNGTTPGILNVQGQISLESSPVRAWQKFQAALSMDSLNLGAVIGLAKVLEQYGRVRDGKIESTELSPLFSTAQLELESVRFVLSLLDNFVARDPGRHTPEAWYFRGVLAEALGDTEGARQALWTSVALEERIGIRSFSEL